LYTTYAIYSKASDFLTKAMQFKQEQQDEEANSATLAKTYSLLADLFRKQAQFQVSLFHFFIIIFYFIIIIFCYYFLESTRII